MDPITLSVLSGVLFWAIDRRKAKGEARGSRFSAAPSLENFTLPTIGAPETTMFTHLLGGVRHFDRAVSAGMAPFLSARSAVPIPLGPLAQAAPAARVYRVMPLARGAELASDIFARAKTESQTVLGSLSLISLPLGSQDPMLLIVGGSELRTFVAGNKGDFALLYEPVIEKFVHSPPAAPPAPEKKEDVIRVEAEIVTPPAPASKPNGAKKPEPAPEVTEPAGGAAET